MDITNYQFYHNLTKLPYIKEIWLFGSRAREDNQERADIDLAISCSNTNDLEWYRIMDIIDEADTLLSIDCIRMDNLSKSSTLRKSIEEQGKKIYERSKN